jgi:hypothetical protein
LILFAQAVPDAALVPCVTVLPVAWSVRSVGTRNGEAVIFFENDAYDATAQATFAETCSTEEESGNDDGEAMVSGPEGAPQFVQRFAGGCFVIEFPPQIAERDAEDLADAVRFLERDELRDRTGWTL